MTCLSCNHCIAEAVSESSPESSSESGRLESPTSPVTSESGLIDDSVSGLIDEYTADADDEMTICDTEDATSERGGVISVIDQPPPYCTLMDSSPPGYTEAVVGQGGGMGDLVLSLIHI